MLISRWNWAHVLYGNDPFLPASNQHFRKVNCTSEQTRVTKMAWISLTSYVFLSLCNKKWISIKMILWVLKFFGYVSQLFRWILLLFQNSRYCLLISPIAHQAWAKIIMFKETCRTYRNKFIFPDFICSDHVEHFVCSLLLLVLVDLLCPCTFA